ncbi:hypothetical protein F66182_7707 [Fusarium sp. NRRL 66182]|nr:hypothetical protein F66182_7707 [Fusarium sp. NRRL 66182]
MLAQALLVAALVCNVSGRPYMIVDPEEGYNTWQSHDYNTTHIDTPGAGISWEFTLQGRNPGLNPGHFAALCQGVQAIAPPQDQSPPAFVPCNDTAYEARQYYTPQYTTVEVRHIDYPDLGKKVQTSATANYTSTNDDIVKRDLTFGNFQIDFFSGQ